MKSVNFDFAYFVGCCYLNEGAKSSRCSDCSTASDGICTIHCSKTAVDYCCYSLECFVNGCLHLLDFSLHLNLQSSRRKARLKVDDYALSWIASAVDSRDCCSGASTSAGLHFLKA